MMIRTLSSQAFVHLKERGREVTSQEPVMPSLSSSAPSRLSRRKNALFISSVEKIMCRANAVVPFATGVGIFRDFRDRTNVI
jgi:hypothetical protein